MLGAIALAVPAVTASPAALDTHAITYQGEGSGEYLVTQLVVDNAGSLTLTNADLRSHDLVAVDDGPDDKAWCVRYANRGCPLFASPLVGLGGQAQVQGIEGLESLGSYEFYCSIHPWMTGTITVI